MEKPKIALTAFDESTKAGYVFTDSSFTVLTKEIVEEADGYKLVYTYTLNITADGYLIDDPTLDKVNSFIYLSSTDSEKYNTSSGCALVTERISFQEASTSCQAFQILAKSLEKKLPLPQNITIDASKGWKINIKGTELDCNDICMNYRVFIVI